MSSADRDVTLRVLESTAGRWVPVRQIIAAGIADPAESVRELRRRGYRVESKNANVRGELHEWFRLREVQRA